jgi:hypothetical protein
MNNLNSVNFYHVFFSKLTLKYDYYTWACSMLLNLKGERDYLPDPEIPPLGM